MYQVVSMFQEILKSLTGKGNPKAIEEEALQLADWDLQTIYRDLRANYSVLTLNREWCEVDIVKWESTTDKALLEAMKAMKKVGIKKFGNQDYCFEFELDSEGTSIYFTLYSDIDIDDDIDNELSNRLVNRYKYTK